MVATVKGDKVTVQSGRNDPMNGQPRDAFSYVTTTARFATESFDINALGASLQPSTNSSPIPSRPVASGGNEPPTVGPHIESYGASPGLVVVRAPENLTLDTISFSLAGFGRAAAGFEPLSFSPSRLSPGFLDEQPRYIGAGVAVPAPEPFGGSTPLRFHGEALAVSRNVMKSAALDLETTARKLIDTGKGDQVLLALDALPAGALSAGLALRLAESTGEYAAVIANRAAFESPPLTALVRGFSATASARPIKALVSGLPDGSLDAALAHELLRSGVSEGVVLRCSSKYRNLEVRPIVIAMLDSGKGAQVARHLPYLPPGSLTVEDGNRIAASGVGLSPVLAYHQVFAGLDINATAREMRNRESIRAFARTIPHLPDGSLDQALARRLIHEGYALIVQDNQAKFSGREAH